MKSCNPQQHKLRNQEFNYERCVLTPKGIRISTGTWPTISYPITNQSYLSLYGIEGVEQCLIDRHKPGLR